MESSVKDLVDNLREVYQPIFGFTEYDHLATRSCNDRLTIVMHVANELRKILNRPLRILELGCAQGYFSLTLAAAGNEVYGIERRDENIALCTKLAEINSLKATFINDDLVSGLAKIPCENFDLMLGLSVFHHLCRERGISLVNRFISELAQRCTINLIETALRNEPALWASAQPKDPRDFLTSFAFAAKISEHPTHLAKANRPLFFCSNNYWYANGNISKFDCWSTRSHELVGDNYRGTRRYYFNDHQLLKYYRFGEIKNNHEEFQREISFLKTYGTKFANLPKLIDATVFKDEGWILRDKINGTLLSTAIINNLSYDPLAVINSILQQLVTLEQHGLYHNDLRVWNVLLVDHGNALLIDYGAINNTKKNISDPNNIYLAFIVFVYEVISQQILTDRKFKSKYLNQTNYPVHYHKWLINILNVKPKLWDFKLFQSLLDQPQNSPSVKVTHKLQAWLTKLEKVKLQNNKFKAKYFEYYFMWKLNRMIIP